MEFLKSETDVLPRARTQPALIILDLNFQGVGTLKVDALKLVAELKADAETKDIHLLGYLSHVQVELKQKAQEAGCDTVLPRSAFSQGLPQILKRHAG